MFLRKKKNKSGSVSIQIIQKHSGKYKVYKTIGCAKTEQQIHRLWIYGKQEIERIGQQSQLFVDHQDVVIEQVFSNLSNTSIKTIGPELIFGSIYKHIGFDGIAPDLFRHLVVARLAFPLSKLRTSDYLYRYLGISVKVGKIYRFLDHLNKELKDEVEQVVFKHTQKILGNKLTMVFYDMTTLYFEASREDELRQLGYSKDGKAHKPQIYIGLLVGLGGYPIGYDIYQGSISEGDTLIPFLEKIAAKFNLCKPIIIADAGLLSNKNIIALEAESYQYILGGRIKNETRANKAKITKGAWQDGQVKQIYNTDGKRLIVSYSQKRADKDAYNRQRGLKRLEKQLQSGKLTKKQLNNRGYNKYLKMDGEVNIAIDYQKYENDKVWDGLKGYVSNSKLSKKQIINNYKNLWHIEKAFRMSKTDLRIRPIYHRIEHRIRAHICLSFVAYCIYKELERVLYQEKSTLSVERATQLCHTIYQITYQLPQSKQYRQRLLKMDEQQTELYEIIRRNYRVSQ